MKKYFLLPLLLLGCQSNQSDRPKDCLKVNEGDLIIKVDSVDNILLRKRNLSQRAQIGENGIDKIENYFSCPEIKNHLNTWIKINESGSVNYEESHFLDHRFFSKENDAYLNLRFRTANDPDGAFYVLYSDYDTNYHSLSNKIDTVFFDLYGKVEIKLNKMHAGSNIVRAKVIKASKGKKQVTYFEKDLYIDFE
jgi:hypothetical protein